MCTTPLGWVLFIQVSYHSYHSFISPSQSGAFPVFTGVMLVNEWHAVSFLIGNYNLTRTQSKSKHKTKNIRCKNWTSTWIFEMNDGDVDCALTPASRNTSQFTYWQPRIVAKQACTNKIWWKLVSPTSRAIFLVFEFLLCYKQKYISGLPRSWLARGVHSYSYKTVASYTATFRSSRKKNSYNRIALSKWGIEEATKRKYAVGKGPNRLRQTELWWNSCPAQLD